ncbi:hypothetical protein KIH27_02220 [Mycobacterium sp. M1]|uniref:Halobacterial output domain-containing protein n=1 Tax=Mycolicibacter acidiphilus TaxID=2835306 RepID=A0ABS5RG06_9MYCO|nr:hypothetical protein [Mycolicibacter acidiphilus]MBS9532401.1 hypothetical protein [Mycolicibacter acidiphilus]
MTITEAQGVDGFNEDGYDADGYDENGFDEDGRDRDGYDEDGLDDDGLDRDGVPDGDLEKLADRAIDATDGACHAHVGDDGVERGIEVHVVNDTTVKLRLYGQYPCCSRTATYWGGQCGGCGAQAYTPQVRWDRGDDPSTLQVRLAEMLAQYGLGPTDEIDTAWELAEALTNCEDLTDLFGVCEFETVADDYGMNDYGLARIGGELHEVWVDAGRWTVTPVRPATTVGDLIDQLERIGRVDSVGLATSDELVEELMTMAADAGVSPERGRHTGSWMLSFGGQRITVTDTAEGWVAK